MGADNNCERNKIDDELTRMSNFVRFLVRIYFLPLKLEENQSKATFSLCSLPAILNFLFYYVSSVSLCCINQVLYYSSLQEEWDAVIDSISFVDILSSTSFHSLILLLFPGLPLLLGRVIIKQSDSSHALPWCQYLFQAASNASSISLSPNLSLPSDATRLVFLSQLLSTQLNWLLWQSFPGSSSAVVCQLFRIWGSFPLRFTSCGTVQRSYHTQWSGK